LIKIFQATFVRTIFSFLRVGALQRAPGHQLSASKVEGQEHMALGLQLSTPKVEGQEHMALGLQLSTPKVVSQEHRAFGIQLSVLKVESRKHRAIEFFFFSLMLIGSLFFCIHLNIILVVNTYVFQVSYENKVDLVLVDVPSILSILHISKPFSFILPWNR